MYKFDLWNCSIDHLIVYVKNSASQNKLYTNRLIIVLILNSIVLNIIEESITSIYTKTIFKIVNLIYMSIHTKYIFSIL